MEIIRTNVTYTLRTPISFENLHILSKKTLISSELFIYCLQKSPNLTTRQSNKSTSEIKDE